MKYLQVAAAVLTRPEGMFLLAQRPEGKPFEGYWEFPGGKIEAGESAEQALKRELSEELGIEIRQMCFWQKVHFVYPHADVELHFFHVTAWQGEPYGREGQALCWRTMENCTSLLLLPANHGILDGLPDLFVEGRADR